MLGWTALVCVWMITKLDKRALPINARGFALCTLLLTTLLVSCCGRVTADGKIDPGGPSGYHREQAPGHLPALTHCPSLTHARLVPTSHMRPA